ncbi:50S ribosomal protein L22 [candidate division Kazan bacterium RBG_13_50_9]|uniref:Large ribosomal subunit protein uL22 n=1 Tax=candidate division Kazan bacterium RBG_13_50_9 TaxID=1798535 RepID=A0A1F4NT02_UNCK3|nr:MAG: 50S ribosomal protein L22 [candidate division Kazan bacterium RBG_13_50_9]
MEVSAHAKFIRISPKKVRPLLKDLRGKNVEDALAVLRYAPTKAGKLLYKLISSAAASASNNYNLKPSNLGIKTLTANDAPRYKRYWLRSRGSSDILLKRSAHLSVTLEELMPTPLVKERPPVKSAPGRKAKSEALLKEAGAGAQPKAGEPESQTAQAAAPLAVSSPKESRKQKRMDIKRIFRRTTNK